MTSRMDFRWPPPRVHWNDCEEATMCGISDWKARPTVFRSHPTSGHLTSNFRLPRGMHLSRYFQDYQSVKKTPLSANSVTFFSQISERAIADAEERLPEVPRREKAKTGLFTLNTALLIDSLTWHDWWHSESVMQFNWQLNDISFL